MFDVGFWEVCLIIIVALLVLNPKQLAALARKLGQLFKKGRDISRDIKTRIDDEINPRE